ncbi:AraC family transcriptional regulator [Brevibacillus sp. RS1.1]|uniref:GyrI-like domain-containing protein n=1 Tax=Brevibacillus sp. RS1.1 TaxID=2738982 RepID=UPI00156ADD93|nr:GyrI-like domain-containing protein [Brevibacillus sp. RS1.1]NRR01946.1 AraC family transcriptional regulator [Brevibacillus sp. RS1.1]
MEGTIVHVPQKHLIGLSFSGSFPMLVEYMPKLWETFLKRQDEIPLVISPDVRYDISDENRTHQMYTEYIVVEVERFEHIPEGMVGFTIPAKTYARFTHTGPMEQVQNTYHSLFGWLNENGHQVNEQALRMERYDQRYVPSVHESARVDNAYEIFIPLR